MSKFQEKKQQLLKDANASATTKITDNKQLFNELATAILNDPDYEDREMVTRKGEIVESVTKPVAELRKKLIGSVAKAAGADNDEVTKLVDTHEFPVLPMYAVVADCIEEYCGSGKAFRFGKREDLQGTIKIVTEEECIKEHNNPRAAATGGPAKTKKHYQRHRKYRVESKCPAALTNDVN